MKIIKKFFTFITLITLCISMLSSCADTLDAAPSSISSLYASSASIDLDESFFKIRESFEESDKYGGYIPHVVLEVEVMGYDADFTYFNAEVTVTWTFTEISDDAPSGEFKEISVNIPLNASGDGYYRKVVKLDGCRKISNVKAYYDWSGTATKL